MSANPSPAAGGAVSPVPSQRGLPPPLDLARSLWVPLTMAAIVLLAAVVRLYHLVQNPPGFFCDEASYGFNAYTILHHGKDEFGAHYPIFFKAFGEYKLPLYIYSQVPITAFIGLSELSVRLTSAFYGIGTVVMIFFLARELFKKPTYGIVAALVLAISPWHIFYSRTGLGEVIVWPFFLVLSLYLFMLGLRRPWVWLLAAVSFGLTFYAYRPAWVTLPPLFLVLTLCYWREGLKQWRIVLASLVIIGVIIAPIPRHVRNVDSDRSEQESILKLHLGFWGTISRFEDHYARHFQREFLFETTTESNQRHIIPDSNWVYVWQVPFLLLGMGGLLWRPTRPKIVVLTLLALYPVATSVTQGSPSSSRAIMGCVPFTLITAFGIVNAVDFLRTRNWRVRKFALGGALAAGLVGVTFVYGSVAFAQFLTNYHGKYHDFAQGYGGWQWGAGEIMHRFEKERDNYDTLVFDGAAFNAADIFERFYMPEEGCPKCRVGNWDYYDPTLRQLFIVRPEYVSPAHNFDIKEFIRSPNGDLAFVVATITDGPHQPPGRLPMAWIGTEGRSVEELDAAIETNPNDPALHNDRGNALWATGVFWEAIYAYNRAIELDPQMAAAYYNRGNVRSAVGIYDLASDDYNAASSNPEFFARASNNIGDIRNRVHDYASAIQPLNDALVQDPNLAIAYANRARAFAGTAVEDKGLDDNARAQRINDALADADHAIELDANLAFAYEVRGELHLMRGEYDQARSDFSRAIELDPQDADALSGRGYAALRLNDPTPAIADLNDAIAANHDDALSYAYRGLAQLQTGDAAGGTDSLERAVEFDQAFEDATNDRNVQYGWSLASLDQAYVDALNAAAPNPDDGLRGAIDYIASARGEEAAEQ